MSNAEPDAVEFVDKRKITGTKNLEKARQVLSERKRAKLEEKKKMEDALEKSASVIKYDEYETEDECYEDDGGECEEDALPPGCDDDYESDGALPPPPKLVRQSGIRKSSSPVPTPAPTPTPAKRGRGRPKKVSAELEMKDLKSHVRLLNKKVNQQADIIADLSALSKQQMAKVKRAESRKPKTTVLINQTPPAPAKPKSEEVKKEVSRLLDI